MALRIPLYALVLLLLSYLTACLLMTLRQRDFIYYPQFTRVDPARTDFALRRDGVTLRGWRVNPGRPHALIYLGGNAEAIEHMRERLAAWLPQRTSYLVAYRGYGASDGVPDEQALAADAIALFDEVRARHPGGRIAVVGRSLGSGVAAHVAAERPVERLVLITPFDSLVSVARAHMGWLPVGRLLQDRYESAQRLRRYRGPVLVIRAGRDAVVPADSTRRLVEALAQPPTVVDLPRADHNEVDADPAFGEALRSFLD